MTEFRIHDSGKQFSVDFESKEFIGSIGYITYTRVNDKTIRLDDIDNITEGHRGKELVREEFIQRFGTTPMRLLMFTVANHFGSEEHGLTLDPGDEFLRPGKRFMKKLVNLGFLERRGKYFFISPQIIKKTKEHGSVKTNQDLKIHTGCLQELFPAPKPKSKARQVAYTVRKWGRTNLARITRHFS